MRSERRSVAVLRASLVGAGLIALSAASGMAQFDAGAVSGYVRDSSGAALAHSTLTLKNVQTGAVRTVVSGADGLYQFVSVPVGRYTVTSEEAGFATTATPEFALTVNAQQRVDLSMAVGGETTTVEVSAAPTLLETETSSRGQLIGQEQVQALPLNGRSYADLTLLVPGVAKSVLENQSATSREASYNVNGQRSAFNNFLLDGLDNNTYGTSNQGFANENIPPSPDAVGEFRVETDNYSAEFGRSSGAVINVTTRRGTNGFHGRVWEYNRNTALNAIGPFNSPGGVKPTFIRNQFGGTFGGPIRKDRLFFFADYEGTRQISKGYSTATLPTADQRAGNLGSTLTNPLTGVTYVNGVIPAADFSPLAAAVFAALPAPNAPGASNYIAFPRSTVQDDKGDVRVDWTPSQRLQLFGRWSDHEATIFVPGTIPGSAGGNNNGNVHLLNRQLAVGVTYTLSPSSVLDARVGFGWNEGGKTPIGVGQPSLLTAAGITDGIPTDPQVVRPLNAQIITGLTQLGDQPSNPQFQNPWVKDPKVNYTLERGRHTIKLGYEFQSVSTSISDFNPTYGQDTYNGQFSKPAGTAASAAAPNSVYNLADFIFGLRSNYQLNNFRIVGLEQKFNFMYAQDDWKVSPHLTVNMGLRYEIATPQYEDNNHLANFDPATGSLVQATGGSMYNRSRVNTQFNNLAPRFGFSYSADANTVLRGGYGISYTQFNREGGENLLVYNGPYIVNASIDQKPSLGLCTNDTAAPTTCFRPTQAGYPPTLVDPSAFSPLKAQSRYIPRDTPTGYVQSYFVGVQRQIGRDIVLDLAYVGSKSTHLMVLADYNQAAINPVTATCNASVGIVSGCLSLQQRRPVQNFNTIEIATGIGFANYNSLQFKVEKRMGHGVYLLNSFTYSRAFDDASGHLETNNGDNSRVNWANPRSDYGPSGYDQPLNNTTSLVWDLPIFRTGQGLAHSVLGGWQLTGISMQTSGLTTNLNYSANSNFTTTGLYTFRPNVTGAPMLPGSARVKAVGGPLQYLNPATVAVPTGNSPYGNASRNSLRSPSFSELDLGLHKAFQLWREGTNLDIRGEAFNVLNQVNYGSPDSNRSNSTYGQISSNFPARQLQVAAKLFF